MASFPQALAPVDFASDIHSRQCSIGSSAGGYPLVCPVTAVTSSTPTTPKPLKTSSWRLSSAATALDSTRRGSDTLLSPKSGELSTIAPQTTLYTTASHAHSIVNSSSQDYTSRTNTIPPDDLDDPIGRFASVRLDPAATPQTSELREAPIPLPSFTLPHFLVPPRPCTPPIQHSHLQAPPASYQSQLPVPLQNHTESCPPQSPVYSASQGPTPSPLIQAANRSQTPHSVSFAATLRDTPSWKSEVSLPTIVQPTKLDNLHLSLPDCLSYQDLGTAATTGAFERALSQEQLRPATNRNEEASRPATNRNESRQPPKSRVITLAELERRLSLASLPSGLGDYASLVKASAAFRDFSKKDYDARSLGNRGGGRQGQGAERRRHSADSLRKMTRYFETLSSVGGSPSPKSRTKSRAGKGMRSKPRLRDDVTADWSSIASTEESVSYYAVKKRGRGLGQKARREGASFYHPPPADALAARFAAAPIYGPLLPAMTAAEVQALTPVASRSLLTCSNDFKKQYPFVYQGLCKGILDIQRLIAHEIVVPVKEDVSLRRSTIRSRKAVTNAICDQLWRSLQGKFPDPSVAPKLIRKMADYIYDKIEYGIQDAEDERSFLQWLFRFDVENAIDLRQNTTIQVGKNSVLCYVEGSAHLKRRKGDFFNMVSPDVVTLNIEMVIKALFLNGGHLLEINSDSRFIDRVSAGENRFAQNFLLG